MTSYRQLQSDDASDQFDLDSQPDSFRSREETEIHIEPTRRAQTTSRIRLPHTACTKNRAIVILAIMMLIFFLVAVLSIYKLQQHGVACHAGQESEATTLPGAATTAAPLPTTAPAPQATTPSGEPFPWNLLRLPETIEPLDYKLFLHPNLTTFDVRGNVSIHFRTVQSVQTIILHSKDMTIMKPDSIQLAKQSSTVKVIQMLQRKTTDQVAFKLATSLDAGVNGFLNLDFNYTLEEGLEGFYRSSYKKNGEKRYIATTQFEATAARMAFPCFDEPAMKATFSLTLVRDIDYITLFNMPAVRTSIPLDDGGGAVYDVYPPTEPMSTYLVAFVICDFTNIAAVTSTGTDVSVYAPAEQLSQGQLALQVVNKTIPFYESLFNISYPLPKQDMIAIPDFSSGAMENWGLITYRESSILYQPNVTSSPQEAWIVITVTHELAHQWFGNLVTMSWWNDLWLNEGFASFVEYIGAHNFRPELGMMDTFILDTTQRAMLKDQLSNSHPISVPVKDPAEISQLFDYISYSKGATILKMLQHFLMKDEEDVMMRGIQSYLQQYQYNNTETADLWAAITQAQTAEAGQSPVDIASMMETWTLQMGFPVVNMTRSDQKIIATQQRFLIYPNGQPSSEFNSTFGYRWTVPLTYFTDVSSSIQSVTFSHGDVSISLSIPSDAKWFKANSKQSGMYRVNYDTATWKALIKQLQTNHTVFAAGDRTSLIDDAFNLAWAGYINYEIALNLSLYLTLEDEYVPVQAGLDSLGHLGSILRGREGYAYYKAYVLQLFSRRKKNLGFVDEGVHLDRLLRRSLMATFRELGDRETLNWTGNKYREWMEHNATDVGANLQGVVQCGGLHYGHAEEWDYAWNRYLTTTSATERSSLLWILACTQDPDVLSRYLQWSLDSEKVRQQDRDTVIRSVASYPAGSYMAFRFLVDNWDLIKERIGDQPFVMSSLITGTTFSFSTEFEYNNVKQFFAAHQAGSGARAVRQSLENIMMRIEWLRNHEQAVTQWLKKATTQLQSQASS